VRPAALITLVIQASDAVRLMNHWLRGLSGRLQNSLAVTLVE
jgi:hypothetical protein